MTAFTWSTQQRGYPTQRLQDCELCVVPCLQCHLSSFRISFSSPLGQLCPPRYSPSPPVEEHPRTWLSQQQPACQSACPSLEVATLAPPPPPGGCLSTRAAWCSAQTVTGMQMAYRNRHMAYPAYCTTMALLAQCW